MVDGLIDRSSDRDELTSLITFIIIKGGSEDSKYGDVDRAFMSVTASDVGGGDSDVGFGGSRETISDVDGRSL